MCKREVYADYTAYCRANGHEPTNPSSFGKLVHSVFPTVGMRRIGTRGQSLPHYNNFARREPGDPQRQRRQQQQQQQQSEHTAHRPSQQWPHRGREPQPQRPVPTDGGDDDDDEEEECVEYQERRPAPGLPLPPLPPSQHQRSKRRHHPSLPPSSTSSSTSSASSSLPSSPPARKRLRVTERSAAEEAAVRERSAVVGAEAAGGVGHRAAIWTSDAHLGLLNVGNGYRTMFFEFSWPLFPLHPAALHGDNLYYLLCTKEGREERSPLSLSVNFMLSVGSLLTGDVVRAKEFFMNARDILGDLFDQTDYDIAQVLLPMASYTDYWLPAEEASRVRMYYLTLASQICEHLGALNSNAYFRCLIGFMSSIGGFSLSEAEFERRWEEAKQAPAWPIHLSAQGHRSCTADASPMHSTHSTQPTAVSGGGQRESSWEPGATGIEVEFREELLPLHTHRLMHLTCRPIVNVMKGIFLYKMGGAPDASFLAQLLPSVDQLEREVEAHMYSDTPVHYCLYYILVLHIKALKAECYALLGYPGLAARLARAFVQLAEQAGREYVTYCFTLIRDVVGLMVDLLLRAGDWAAVRALLGLIEHRIPYLAGVAGRYLAALSSAEEAAGLAPSCAAAAGDPARPMSNALALALSQRQRQQGAASPHVPSPPTALVAGLASASPSPASTFSTPPSIVVAPHSEQRLPRPPHFPGGT